MRIARLSLGLLFLSACASPPDDNPVTRQYHRRSVVYAKNGMVAAAHPKAVEIGLQILKNGGNAIDAAIATNAALGFLEPTSCGIGGDLFAIVWDAKTKKLYGLNASGRSPASLTIEKVTPREDGTIDPRSPDGWSVPGCVGGWFSLHEKFGSRPMKELLRPTVQIAREGWPVPRMIAYYWGRAARVFKDMPGFAEVFMPGGQPVREGQVFKNPALADSYYKLATGGRDAYYKGAIAKDIVAFSQKHGGHFTLEDFANHKSEWVDPVSTNYRGVDVWELPPNGQGIAALQMLNILETFDLKAMGRNSADFWHVMIEAKKLAFEDRARYYADPAMADVPIQGLISKDYGKERAKLINMSRAARTQDAGKLDHGDTTFLVTADREGNMVSLIQSNYTGFGSGHVVGGFGLQNRGQLFNLDPGHPNALQPGKRPFHTIIPAFATKDGKPWLTFGVMGGSMQPQGHVQIIVNLVDFGMDLQQAGDAPRFRHLGSSQPTGTVMTEGGTVTLEDDVPGHIFAELKRRGHVFGRPGSFGGYQAILRENGIYAGATESRKDGVAMGY